MIVYLDTSAVLRPLLGQARVLSDWGAWESAYASELLEIEARRVIDRMRIDHAMNDDDVAEAYEQLSAIERALNVVPLTRAVLQRAALPMPTVVRTLDALHLSTAMLVREARAVELTFATHDPQQARAARAFGFDCIGV